MIEDGAPLSFFVIINLVSAGMRMADPLPTFAEVVKRIRVGYPDFAYLHVFEPTTHHRPGEESGTVKDSNKLLRDIWSDGAYITSDFGSESVIKAVEKEGGLFSFARHFIYTVSKCFLSLSTTRGRDADLS